VVDGSAIASTISIADDVAAVMAAVLEELLLAVSPSGSPPVVTPAPVVGSDGGVEPAAGENAAVEPSGGGAVVSLWGVIVADAGPVGSTAPTPPPASEDDRWDAIWDHIATAPEESAEEAAARELRWRLVARDMDVADAVRREMSCRAREVEAPIVSVEASEAGGEIEERPATPIPARTPSPAPAVGEVEAEEEEPAAPAPASVVEELKAEAEEPASPAPTPTEDGGATAAGAVVPAAEEAPMDGPEDDFVRVYDDDDAQTGCSCALGDFCTTVQSAVKSTVAAASTTVASWFSWL
jgi:hypothetical protein